MEFKGTKGCFTYDKKTKLMLDNEGYIVPMPSNFSSTRTEESVFGNDPNWIEAQYNIHLFSKAPEMLEMLQKVNELFIRTKFPTEREMIEYSDEIEQLIKQATEL
jgi:hypothetical protein